MQVLNKLRGWLSKQAQLFSFWINPYPLVKVWMRHSWKVSYEGISHETSGGKPVKRMTFDFEPHKLDLTNYNLKGQ